MASQSFTEVEQQGVVVPDLTIKDLLDAIPSHCYKRSAIRSGSYIIYDLLVIAGIYSAATYTDAALENVNFPSPLLHSFSRFALWALYAFAVGLPATGLWVIGHECGHQAFSDSKTINNTVGWLVHSSLGVPYHSWRITHGKHHASTGHMMLDQVFVPKTRTDYGLPALNPAKENYLGSRVSDDIKAEFWEALGDSPIGAAIGSASYLIGGWPMYLIRNAAGQRRYPKGTSHFKPSAVMFGEHQRKQIMLSDLGMVLWLGAIIGASFTFGFGNVFRVYLAPYLWVNHWLVLITFLQHTDPLLPHYRAPEFTFARGALSTLDRQLLGDCGALMGFLGTHFTHGISETHVAHHVSSKIPHYNAWEATDALRKLTTSHGLKLQGAPGGWREVYRAYKSCKFVEDDGPVVFYKNAHGLAAAKPVMPDAGSASDSGIEVDK